MAKTIIGTCSGHYASNLDAISINLTKFNCQVMGINLIVLWTISGSARHAVSTGFPY